MQCDNKMDRHSPPSCLSSSLGDYGGQYCHTLGHYRLVQHKVGDESLRSATIGLGQQKHGGVVAKVQSTRSVNFGPNWRLSSLGQLVECRLWRLQFYAPGATSTKSTIPLLASMLRSNCRCKFHKKKDGEPTHFT